MNPHCVTDARRECCGKLENGDWLLFRTWASWLRREKHQEYFTQCEPKMCDGGWNRAFLILVRIFLHKWPETKQCVNSDKEFHNCKNWRQPWPFVCFTFASDGDQIQTLDLNRFWSTYTNNHKANCRSLGFRLIYTSTPLLKVDNHGQIILQRNRWLILKGELKCDPNKLLTIAHFQDSHADSHLTQSLVESFFWKGEAEQWSLELTLRGFEVLKFVLCWDLKRVGWKLQWCPLATCSATLSKAGQRTFPRQEWVVWGGWQACHHHGKGWELSMGSSRIREISFLEVSLQAACARGFWIFSLWENIYHFRFDVLVIGGGIMGSSTAHWLAKKTNGQLKVNPRWLETPINGGNFQKLFFKMNIEQPKVQVCVVEPDPSYSTSATTLSVGGLRSFLCLVSSHLKWNRKCLHYDWTIVNLTSYWR